MGGGNFAVFYKSSNFNHNANLDITVCDFAGQERRGMRKARLRKLPVFALRERRAQAMTDFLLIIIIFLLLAIFGRLENVGKGEKDNAGKRDRK